MTYKIDPEVLTKVANEVKDLPLENGEMFTAVIGKLSGHYPDLIENKQRRWMGSRAGGCLGKLFFLYASLTEYVLVYGSPAGTQGFSGRYNFMEVYKSVLAGKITTYDLESDQITPTVLLPGDASRLEKGHSRGVTIQAGSWHIEYGRGPNITALPFGLADTLISSVELKSLILTMAEYAHFLMKGLLGPR